jgi:hypothetical protein
VQQTNDDGYIITGTCITGVSNSDAFLLKLNSLGNLMWMKTYENVINTSNDYGNSVQQTSDYGYMVIGNVYNPNSGALDPYLLKTDSSGNFQWNKIYHGTYLSNSHTAMQTFDYGYIIGISSLDSISSTYDIGVIKTDYSGNISWSKLYGGPLNDDYPASIEQTSDGGYIIAGSRYDAVNDFEYYLIKTDSTGNSGCFDTNFTTSVIIPSVIVTNQILSDSSGMATTSPFIVTEQGGSVITLCSGSTGIAEGKKQNSFSVFPNPAVNEINISFPIATSLIISTRIFKLTGEIVFADENKATNNYFKKTIDISNFDPGIYIIRAYSDTEAFQRKLIIITR